MGSELSMKSRAEITSRYANAYLRAGKKDKGRILDEVVSVTGWSRHNARRRLAAALTPPTVCPTLLPTSRADPLTGPIGVGSLA